ncbi:MAG: hypothetical protein HYV40_05435 [Candidatus Levybacteria bacterium]|nr:hypothetical protein [Candidatus Levybacteria bacterium]
MDKEHPPLYTQEVIVFRTGVDNADVSQPVTVAIDAAGNHALFDGNHRAKRSEKIGEPLSRNIVGRLPFDVSQNPNYRLIPELKVVEK